jgi:glycosyltransferase involved in cell wall biosynthesis
MPVRNEAGDLRRAVAAVHAQEYPGAMEICLAVAPSTDDTGAVASALAGEHDDVCVVPNPAGTTPAGLNAAIRATTGEVVVRVDGHAELSPGYIRRAVETLRRTGAANVGGIQRAVGTTTFEQAVADAMSSPFGTGDAMFHYGGAEGPTDTVYLGVFDRAAIERVGLYDEGLERNQDYELNIRLRDDGGIVWFDPQLSVTYRPRGTLRALVRQYFDYGRWKRTVVRRHPRSLRWRQAVPPAVTAAVATGAVAGIVWRKALLLPAGYAGAVAIAAVVAGKSRGRRARLLAIFPTMHLSWGAGFLLG